jgi:hypothetical protein
MRQQRRGEDCIKRSFMICKPYPSPNIISVIKSRRMIQAGHVARVSRGQVHKEFVVVNLRERRHLEDLDVDRRII